LTGGEPVDLFGLAAQDGGELIDGEEDRKNAHGMEYTKQKFARDEYRRVLG